jgi:hypothetical protein
MSVPTMHKLGADIAPGDIFLSFSRRETHKITRLVEDESPLWPKGCRLAYVEGREEPWIIVPNDLWMEVVKRVEVAA